MKRPLALLAFVFSTAAMPALAAAAEPDYAAWDALLARNYDPARGMDYAALRGKDAAALAAVRQALAKVDPVKLSRDEQLAYWINLYNVNVVAVVAEKYPVKSIRDISTDPVVRLNVFKKDTVPVRAGKMSLNDVENKKVREGFKDARIHFAINCAAKSCPPLRSEAYRGARIDAQLDEQAARFLAGPNGVRIGRRGKTLVVHLTKIVDWFGDDFDTWGSGRLAFVRKHLPPEKQKVLDEAGKDVKIEYDDYDWSLNDWKR